MVHQAVEQRRHDDHVAQQRGPVLDRSVGRDDRGAFFVTTHQHVGEFIAGTCRQPAQEQVVDNEQIGSLELRAVLAQLAVREK